MVDALTSLLDESDVLNGVAHGKANAVLEIRR
jgi:hypothetical protein